MEELLPIGSKVELQNGRRVIIIGYLPSKPNDDVLYDYICCRNKLGIRKKKKDLTFNIDYFYIKKEDISKVLYLGYVDDESQLFIRHVTLFDNELTKAKRENLNIDNLEEFYLNILENINRKHGDTVDE